MDLHRLAAHEKPEEELKRLLDEGLELPAFRVLCALERVEYTLPAFVQRFPNLFGASYQLLAERILLDRDDRPNEFCRHFGPPGEQLSSGMRVLRKLLGPDKPQLDENVVRFGAVIGTMLASVDESDIDLQYVYGWHIGFAYACLECLGPSPGEIRTITEEELDFGAYQLDPEFDVVPPLSEHDLPFLQVTADSIALSLITRAAEIQGDLGIPDAAPSVDELTNAVVAQANADTEPKIRQNGLDRLRQDAMLRVGKEAYQRLESRAQDFLVHAEFLYSTPHCPIRALVLHAVATAFEVQLLKIMWELAEYCMQRGSHEFPANWRGRKLVFNGRAAKLRTLGQAESILRDSSHELPCEEFWRDKGLDPQRLLRELKRVKPYRDSAVHNAEGGPAVNDYVEWTRDGGIFRCLFPAGPHRASSASAS